MKNKKLIIGLLCLLLSFGLAVNLNRPTSKEKVFSFSSTYKGKDVTLQASLYEVENSEYAVLICPGYSCDRQKWRPFADLFVGNGFTTMLFDYAGQGASSDTIGFDNAKTDAIPEEIADAVIQLHEKTGISYEKIILVGHSMGGRAILRLMYDYNNPKAETIIDPQNIRNIILFSPEVNYNFSAQASLFAGTSDDTDPIWHEYSELDINNVNVYLYGSTADDIVSDEDILAIYSHLGAANVPLSGTYDYIQINRNGSKLTVGITDKVLHSYQMYSSVFGDYVNDALKDITGKEMSYNTSLFLTVYMMWFIGLAGLGLTISGLCSNLSWANNDCQLTLVDPKKFLLTKALFWLPGLIVAFIVCCICVIMPFGSPVMNTPYMCGIAGYGLTMVFAYRKGKFKGTTGKLAKLSFKINCSGKDLLKCIGISIGLCFVLWYVLRASMYRLIPLNARLFWCLFAGVLMSVGYFVAGCENDMLDQANASISTRIIYNLIQYVALFLLVAFYLVLKSYSGMIGQIQNMLLMYIFCIPLGNYIKQVTNNRLYGAIASAFLFQTLMITSAALIAFL